MHRHTNWVTHRQTDGHKKERKPKTATLLPNAGPPDTDYLYYPLDVEGVTLKGSLLPANTR